MSFEFKYKNEVLELQCSCPPSELFADDKIVYRFVFENIEDSRNYLPPYLISPNRRNTDNYEAQRICNYYALSFYEDNQKMKKYYERTKKLKPLFFDRIGNCIGTFKLEIEYGLRDVAKSDSHFNFYENNGIDFSNKLENVVNLQSN